MSGYHQRDHVVDIQTLKIKVHNLESQTEDCREYKLTELKHPGLNAEGFNPNTLTENSLTQLIPNAKSLSYFTVK